MGYKKIYKPFLYTEFVFTGNFLEGEIVAFTIFSKESMIAPQDLRTADPYIYLSHCDKVLNPV